MNHLMHENDNKITRRVLVIGLGCVLAWGLGACRMDERDRPLTHEKGVYSGKKGTALTPEQQQQLRRRNRLQAGGGL